jgi:hypothetical protein
MLMSAATVRELKVSCTPGWSAQVFSSAEPLVLRGLVSQWPLVQAGTRSIGTALAYLRGYYRNATVGAWFGAPQIRGRFFYNEDYSGFNFQACMFIKH